MKTKIIISLAILALMSMTDVAMAANPSLGVGGLGSTTPGVGDVPDGGSLPKCQYGEMLILAVFEETVGDRTSQWTCEDGFTYCSTAKYSVEYDKNVFESSYDIESNICYLKRKGAPNVSQFTIIPYTSFSVEHCEALYQAYALDPTGFKKHMSSGASGSFKYTLGDTPYEAYSMDILGCGIKTGRMKLWMIPYYIKYLIQFALSIAGLVSVGAMVFGGYLYMFGTLMDDKEKGKRSIIYGIGGFVLVLLAWAIVNVVISLATM